MDKEERERLAAALQAIEEDAYFLAQQVAEVREEFNLYQLQQYFDGDNKYLAAEVMPKRFMTLYDEVPDYIEKHEFDHQFRFKDRQLVVCWDETDISVIKDQVYLVGTFFVYKDGEDNDLTENDLELFFDNDLLFQTTYIYANGEPISAVKIGNIMHGYQQN